MRPSRSRSTVALAAAGALLAGGLTAAATASPAPAAPAAFDYRAVKGLSPDTGVPVAREVIKVPAADGALLHVEVVKPTTGKDLPVILEASPYHGTIADRDGTRILPDPKVDGKSIGLTGFFAPRGYAVAMMDLRGTGKSGGCLDHLGPKDASDLKTVVEFLAKAPFSNGSVGMVGHSYVGSTPMVAAAQKPVGLKTIVPSAGLASMYDHQFQAGVPYNLQYAGPIFAYETLALQRHLPPGATMPLLGGPTGDDFGNNVASTGCGLPQSSATAGHGQVTGQYQAWHAARDHGKGATESDVPAFLVHGVNDNAARITAADWFMDRGARAGDKAWIGQWDHGSGFAPTRRGMQWPFALLGWFDAHLKGKGVDTGPATEVFLNDAPTLAEGIRTAQGQTLQAAGFPAAAPTLTMYPGGTTLSDTAPAPGTRSFSATANGGNVEFATAPLPQDVVVAGVPDMKLAVSVSVPQVNLIATLYERRGTVSRRISQCAIVPLLKDGLDKVATVVPGTVYPLTPPCFAMGHQLRAGSQLVLRIATTDPDKVSTWANDPQVTVATGPQGTRVTLPVVQAPTVVADTVAIQP